MTKFLIPGELADAGIKAVHQRPLVAHLDKVALRRVPVLEAWEAWEYVELNPGHAWAALLYDVDAPLIGPAYQATGRAKILPTWMVLNERNGHAHLAYALEQPVARAGKARDKPIKYLAHVAERLAAYLGADASYNAILTRNPVNPGMDQWAHWYGFLPYTLAELDRRIPKRIKAGRRPRTAVGRNVELFLWAIKEAHRPRWARRILAGEFAAWLSRVGEENTYRFEYPLPVSEVKSISRSCAKYVCRQWSEDTFSKRQTALNSIRHHGKADYDYGERNALIGTLYVSGFTQAEIADMMELRQPRVSKILRGGVKAATRPTRARASTSSPTTPPPTTRPPASTAPPPTTPPPRTPRPGPPRTPAPPALR